MRQGAWKPPIKSDLFMRYLARSMYVQSGDIYHNVVITTNNGKVVSVVHFAAELHSMSLVDEVYLAAEATLDGCTMQLSALGRSHGRLENGDFSTCCYLYSLEHNGVLRQLE